MSLLTQIHNWQAALVQLSKEYKTVLATVDDRTFNTKPNAQTWSVAEVIDHVIKTNESYFPTIADLKAGKHKVPALGRIGFINNFFGNFILSAVEPTRKRKVKTFPVWEPSVSGLDRSLEQKFYTHQEEFARLIESCAPQLEQGALISSRANKNIVYKLDKAFDILVAHEERHLNQIKGIVEALKSNKA